MAVTPPLRLRFLARDFFQNNPVILPAFVTHVTSEAAAAGGRFLIDAYCGSGLFALAAARAFERVAGVEISESSVAFARANAEANASRTRALSPATPRRFSPASISPPRRPSSSSIRRGGAATSPSSSRLFAFGPRAVVYVSCDPATQMRDLRQFLAAGYQLARVRPFDLFPQTRHLECVMTLTRAAG